jgi:AraC-like DNA-binding protein
MTGFRTWAMPLHQRPTVIAAGVVEHGQRAVDRWWLPGAWTFHLYHYEAELLLDGESFTLQPGMAGVIAPGVQQEYRYRGRSPHVYVHLTLPAEGPRVAVPVLHDLGGRFADVRQRLEEAVGDFAVAPLRCQVRVWDLLWDLARLAGGQAGSLDPRVARVVAHIERHLPAVLAVADLAALAGVSHNQLTRLFHAHMGITVVGYLRRRRVERAVYLLAHTDLPVRDIGERVGIPDPVAFAKTVRAIAGRSPRAFRGQVRG